MGDATSSVNTEALLQGDLTQLDALTKSLINSSSIEKELLASSLPSELVRERLRRVQTNPLPEKLKIQLSAQLKQNEQIHPKHIQLLDFIDDWFLILSLEKRVPREIGHELLLLKPAMARLLLADPKALLNNDHPFIKLLNAILSTSFSWNINLGKSGDSYLQLIKEQRERVSFSYLDDLGTFSISLKVIDKFIEQHHDRVKKLENRICDSAIGRIEAQKNRFIAIRQINRLLHGKQYPSALIRFLQSCWKDSLQLARSQSKTPDEISLEYAKLAGALIWSTTPDALKDKAKFYEVTEDLKKKIPDYLISLEPGTAREEAFKQIKMLYLKLGHDEAIELEDVTPIPEDELMPGVKTRISPQILQKVQSIQVGQHFRIKTKDSKLRIVKLTLKSEDARLLIFTNFAGIKALEMNYAEFSWLLTNNQAQAINPANLLVLSRQKALKDILANPAPFKDFNKTVDKPASEIPKPISNTIATASKQKAIDEVEKHITAEVLTPEMPKELNVGSWIEFKTDQGTQKIKLAAHIASMDRYVFVDRSGKKIAQHNHKEIEVLFASGQMTLIQLGNKFETFDQLIGNIASKNTD